VVRPNAAAPSETIPYSRDVGPEAGSPYDRLLDSDVLERALGSGTIGGNPGGG